MAEPSLSDMETNLLSYVIEEYSSGGSDRLQSFTPRLLRSYLENYYGLIEGSLEIKKNDIKKIISNVMQIVNNKIESGSLIHNKNNNNNNNSSSSSSNSNNNNTNSGNKKKRRIEDEDDDEDEDNDNDEDESESSKKVKKARKADNNNNSNNKVTLARSIHGETLYHLGGMRYGSVSNFKGKILIQLREYYEKDGKISPGSKGIALTLDQWQTLKKKEYIDTIDNAINALSK